MGSLHFDTPATIVWNAACLGVWVLAVVVAFRRSRRGLRLTTWGWVALLASWSIDGVFIPVGPALWLAVHLTPDVVDSD